MSWLLGWLFGKVFLLSFTTLGFIGAVALVLLGFRKAGMWLAIGVAGYMALGIFWQDAYASGTRDERAKWQLLVDAARLAQREAIAKAEILEGQLANARREWSKALIEKRDALTEQFEKEAADEEAAARVANPTAPPCRCVDTQRDVDRLHDLLRSQR